jgi:acyl-CoA reductase-like NAD-dependent aldehyde dehydrogenase
MSGKTFETVNPANERVLASIAEGEAEDVDAAVAAAREAFEEGPWSRFGPAERSRALRTLAELFEAHGDELAELEAVDIGMPIGVAQAFLQTSIEYLHYFAGAANSVFGETVPSSPDWFNYTLRAPLGVCGAITPWNGSLMMAAMKMGSALATGNTFVWKPPEQTPLTPLRIGELAMDAGIPDGVVNIVTGFGPTAGAALSAHSDVDKVTFTGSTEVGRLILRASAGSNLKRVTLELGGKSPNIVFQDADVDVAVQASLAGFTVSTGQVCVAGTRLFVEQDFKDEFVEQLANYSQHLKVGDPLDPATAMGPLVSQEQYERVARYLEVGKSEGATARVGGSMADGSGYFVSPTIFDGVNNNMTIAREEIFGPVVSVIPFSDENDAVLQGNDTNYGLAAAVWTRDVSRAYRVARKIRAGSVWVNNYFRVEPNMPFGGYKESGIGREGGPNWYEHYTEQKAVFVKL